jgi:WD40 repeat protein
MRRLRRLFAWAVFFAFLAGVGAGVFHFVRYRPRLTIPELLFITHLSADGSRLITIRPPEPNSANPRGPVQVWDTRSGGVLREFFGSAGPMWSKLSPDARTLAAGLDDGTLWLVDWQSGEQARVDDVDLGPVPSRPPWPVSWFSPRGRWLCVSAAEDKPPSYLIDVAARKVALRFTDKVLAASEDDRLLFVGNKDQVDVWNMEALKKVAALPSGPQAWVVASRDGRSLLTLRLSPPRSPGDAHPTDAVEVWDLTTLTRRFRYEQKPPGYLEGTFSPNGRSLAVWVSAVADHKGWIAADSDFAMLDADTGRLRWSCRIRAADAGAFSSDGALWVLMHRQKNDVATLTVFDVSTGGILWEKPGRSSGSFLGKSAILLQTAERTELLTANTGERTAPLHVGAPEHAPFDVFPTYQLAQTSDGGHFVFAGQQRRDRPPHFWEKWLARWWPNVFSPDAWGLVVMESATGREVLRLVNAGNQSDKLRLSDDAGTLVTVDAFEDGRRLVRVWDVQPTRAWTWATTAAVGTWAVLLVLAWGRRKLAGPKNQP